VRQFLEEEVIPVLADQRLRFRARIAANVLAIIEREDELGPQGESAELSRVRRLLPDFTPEGFESTAFELEEYNEELARRLIDKELVAVPGDTLWEHLRATLLADLEIANPGYLKRIGAT
jgi:hypothetical protein